MKKTGFTVALLSITMLVNAQVIRISGTRLAYPLFQQWANDYKKTHAGVDFVIDSKLPSDSADIVIASYNVQPVEIKPDRQLIAVARYAQLPIINSKQPDREALQQRGFTTADFQAIYFGQAAAATSNSNKFFTLYTRQKPACATKAFASHYGHQTSDIQGIGVVGDDRDLLEAVKKDSNAISYNNLGFIYDLQTRRVGEGIAIIPIDINENGHIEQQERLYNTLDELINYLEKSNDEHFAIEHVNVLLRKQNSNAAKDFLGWVLLQGQSLNQKAGFLTLSQSNAEDQLAILRSLSYDDDLDLLYGKQN